MISLIYYYNFDILIAMNDQKDSSHARLKAILCIVPLIVAGVCSLLVVAHVFPMIMEYIALVMIVGWILILGTNGIFLFIRYVIHSIKFLILKYQVWRQKQGGIEKIESIS